MLTDSKNTASFMSMNFRNRLISQVNSSDSIALAKDRCLSKKLFIQNNIATPKVIKIIKCRSNLANVLDVIETPFVLKPSHGMAGKGILIVKKKSKNIFHTNSGKFNLKELTDYCRNILDGKFSGCEDEVVLVEEYVKLGRIFDSFLPEGTPDIRIIYYKGYAIAAMVRIPNSHSKGKANLSQGALGAAVDIESGNITSIFSKKTKEKIKIPPKLSKTLPRWKEIIETGSKTQRLSGLGYLGVDIVYNQEGKPLVMEINGRPGLEIQNVSKVNLRSKVEEIDHKEKEENEPVFTPRINVTPGMIVGF